MPYTLTEQKGAIDIRAEGSSLADVFMDGARALFSIVADAEHLKGDQRVKIVVDSKDIPSLFCAWLKELAERSEQYNLLFAECSIASIQKVNDSQYLLTGAAYGEPLDPSVHVRKKAIKNISQATYKEEGARHIATCICTFS